MLRKLERYLGKFAIPNLTVYYIVFSGFITAVNIQFQYGLGVPGAYIFSGKGILNLILFPFNLNSGTIFSSPWLGLILFLYIFWIFAQSLEQEMGNFHYNVYLFTGMFLVTIGGMFFPGLVSSNNIYLSVFFATAFIMPNMQILLFFIIPVKMKWIAFFILGFIVFQTTAAISTSGNVLYILGPILGTGNFLLYFGPQVIKNIQMRGKSKKRIIKMNANVPISIHKCHVCGMTEHDDPSMDFRFCVDCSDQEYCREHLYHHEHIK